MKTLTNLTRTRLILIFLASLFGSNAIAQMQGIQLFAEFNDNGKEIKFQWAAESRIEFDSFEIYYTNDFTANLSPEDFELIKELSLDDVEVEEIDDRGNLKILIYEYEAEFGFEDEKQAYFIKGISGNNEIISNPVVFGQNNKPREEIFFSTIPSETASLNEEYIYDADAYSKSDSLANIVYEINTSFNNYEFDEETGILTWTPTQTGTYSYSIVAYLKNNRSVMGYQHAVVRVISCTEPTSISGVIRDEEGELVEEGMVQIFSTGTDNNSGFRQDYYAEVYNGEFNLSVDEGTYVALYQSYKREGIPNWYQGAFDYIDATEIEVACGDNISLDWNVRLDVDYKDRFGIEFTSTPIKTASINNLYTYDANAKYRKDENAELIYELKNAPEGMEIDESTGEISWIPSEAGFYGVYIIAKVKDDTFIIGEQSFGINVLACEEPGTINLTVTNTNGEPFNRGYIGLLKEVTENGGIFIESYSEAEVIDGKVSFEADQGSYLLVIYSQHLPQGILYNNTNDINEATRIEIDCEEVVDLEWEIEAPEIPELVKVSGYCLNKDDSPVHAMVVFEGKGNRNSGSNQHGNHFQTKTMTDDNGYYEVQVLSGLEYVAYAFAEGSNRPVFYDQKNDPGNADRFVVEDDMSDINFIFDGKKEDDHKDRVLIPGSVKSENGDALTQVMVIAVTMDAAGTVRNENGAMSMTNSEGNFELKLEEGIYKFLAFPTNGDYMPGFFVAEDVATMIWKEGTEVEVLADVEIAYNIAIILPEMESVPGIASMNGQVISSRDQNTSIDAANIYLTHNGKGVKFSSSDITGTFAMNNLQAGNYLLTVDKPGYKTFETEVTLSNNSPLDLQIPLEVDGVTGVDYGMNNNFSINPNPVSENINLTMDPEFNANKISIFNINGELISERSLTNSNTESISADILNAGSYYLHISNGNDIQVIPFVVIK